MRGEQMNTYFKTCQICGANLDPAETCTCENEKTTTYSDGFQRNKALELSVNNSDLSLAEKNKIRNIVIRVDYKNGFQKDAIVEPGGTILNVLADLKRHVEQHGAIVDVRVIWEEFEEDER